MKPPVRAGGGFTSASEILFFVLFRDSVQSLSHHVNYNIDDIISSTVLETLTIASFVMFIDSMIIFITAYRKESN